MTNFSISSQLPLYLATNGSGLNNGTVYIGLPNQDPQTFPKTVYWDEAGTDPVDQTNGIPTIGGYITRAGNPATIFIDGTYSIRVRDRFGAQVYYLPIVADLAAALESSGGGEIVGLDDGASGAKFANAQEYVDYLKSFAGSSVLGFLPRSITSSIRTVEEKLREMPTMADYGGYGDGISHTVADWISAGTYPNLAAVQVDYPFVTATTNCANWAALTKMIAIAQTAGSGYVLMGVGVFCFSQQITLTGTGITVIGTTYPAINSGGRCGSTWRWMGGAEPMATCDGSNFTFFGFDVENGTTATCWLQLNAGAIGNRYQKIFGVFPNGTTRLPFSDSFIFSNGERIGYGGMYDCRINSVAPKIIRVISVSGAAVTTFEMTGNVFAASTQNMAVLSVTGETIEVVNIASNTFIMDGFECTAVDTTDSPAAETILSLLVEGNEFDVDSTVAMDASWRFFKLANAANVTFSSNQCYGGGTLASLIRLVNSRVVSCTGNYYNGIVTALIDADAASTVRQGIQGLSMRPVFTTVSAGIYQPTFSASVSLDGRRLDPGKPEIIEIAASSGIGFTVSVDASSPEYMPIGQVFTVYIKNVSGGALGAIVWHSSFALAGAFTSPANGFSRGITFFWDGTKAKEIARTGADVAN